MPMAGYIAVLAAFSISCSTDATNILLFTITDFQSKSDSTPNATTVAAPNRSTTYKRTSENVFQARTTWGDWSLTPNATTVAAPNRSTTYKRTSENACSVPARDHERMKDFLKSAINASRLGLEFFVHEENPAFAAVSFCHSKCGHFLWPEKVQTNYHAGYKMRAALEAAWRESSLPSIYEKIKECINPSHAVRSIVEACGEFRPQTMETAHADLKASVEYFTEPYLQDVIFLKHEADDPTSLFFAMLANEDAANSRLEAEFVWWNVYYPELVDLPPFSPPFVFKTLVPPITDLNESVYEYMTAFYKDNFLHKRYEHIIWQIWPALAAITGVAIIAIVVYIDGRGKIAKLNSILGRCYICKKKAINKLTCTKTALDDESGDEWGWPDDEWSEEEEEEDDDDEKPTITCEHP